MNAVGILSTQNNRPLRYKDEDDPGFLFDIQYKSDTEMILVPRQYGGHNSANYLGGIVSADRTEVFWENTTHPLPTT